MDENVNCGEGTSSQIRNELNVFDGGYLLPEFLIQPNLTERGEKLFLASNSSELSNISSFQSTAPQPDLQQKTDKLRELLCDWEQEFLLEHFLGQQVFVDVLMVIKQCHIERLLKDFDLGTQIMFEHKLGKWRETIGLPLTRYNDNATSSSLPSLSSPPSSPSSRATTPSREPHFLPYQKTEECAILLSNILNETPKGAMLVEYYKKFAKFQEEQRHMLINLISQFFEDKGVSITLAISYRIEKEILERFPTEKLEYYRSNKRGRIYNKFCNLKTSFKSAVTSHVVKETPKKTPKNTCRFDGKTFVPEDDAEICIRALKYDNLTAEQFDQTWKACCQTRLEDLKNFEGTAEIMEKWPFYKLPTGYRLIDMDFTVAFQNADRLVNLWDQGYRILFEFLCDDNHIKDKNIKGLLAKLKSGNTIDALTENSRNASLFWALHGYFVPTTKTVRKDTSSGKNKTTKFTIKDSQEAFLFVGKTAQEVEDHLTYLKQQKKYIQPFIYCIGDDIISIKEIYIYFDGIRYKIFNFLRAVDLCFKIFFVFNLDFPLESAMMYTFIEHHFFKMKSSQKFPKVFILSEHLNSVD